MKPHLDCYKHIDEQGYRYYIFQLTVPETYLVKVKYPRLSLAYWMMRIALKQLFVRTR
jgi:hypothetical protein